MKIYSLIFCLFVFVIESNAQSNIVRNSGAEAGNGDCEVILNTKFNANNQKVDHWANPRNPFVLQYIYQCGTSDVICNSSNVYNGERALYIHINPNADKGYWKEFVVNELASGGVHINHEYYFKARLKFNSSNYNLSDVGIMFSENHPKQKKISKGGKLFDAGTTYNVYLNSSMSTTAGINGFIEVSLNFKYFGLLDLGYMTIGEFKEGSNPGFYIDDIELFDIGLFEDCPQVKYIQNTIQISTVEDADQQLFAGTNVGAPFPATTGEVKIAYGGNVVYKAGEEVILDTGFQTLPGANFLAYIAPCEENPCQGVSSMPTKEYELCSGSPQNISTDFVPTPHYTVKWNPTTHLTINDPYSPIFTPPSGTGVATYLVSFTDPCGTTGYQLIRISYTDGSVAPSITLTNQVLDEYNFSFDFIPQPESEWLEIDIKRKSDGLIVFSTSRMYYNDDYGNPFHFSAPCYILGLSVCYDYEVIVRTKNVCLPDIVTEVIDWNRSSYCTPKPQILTAPLPNVITPNGDGSNDIYCIEVCGAEAYEIEVFNRWDASIYQSSGKVCNKNVCLWNGNTNSGNAAVDGQYELIIKISGCGNSEEPPQKSVTLLR
ncbi:MAG: gliding motility-associated C-terminal domain-containing protein [Flavobacteriales bacterium]|nr:gliding motility-associated C-terminal domain-containing protein [Flavobacteriales bacterium]